MGDATLLPLRSSVSEAGPRSTHSSDPISSDNDVFPFLVHSQNSVINGEPPEVDNGKLARQRRRRTSPEDQARLEAEYKRNPKPDRAARTEILKNVSLGEKELQIWFQNRRQNTRRKSRPLLPHEITAFGLGGLVALSSDLTLQIGSEGANASLSAFNSTVQSGSDVQHQFAIKSSQSSQDLSASSNSGNDGGHTRENLETALFNKVPVTSMTDSGGSSLLQSLFSSQPLPVPLGYLSSRRNPSASSLTTPTPSQTPRVTTSSNVRYSPSCEKRISTTDSSQSSPAQVRISLSLDGKAELVASQVSPPNLHRPRLSSFTSAVSQSRPTGVRPSQSDLPTSYTQGKSLTHITIPSQIPSGRSRDARTWEFCCDTEARDELTTQAENESNGSAVAAISLLRSTCTRNLKFNISKRNAPIPKAESGVHGKKPKLSRASSSITRLQGTDKTLVGSPSGDSDKENWLPQDESSNVRRRNLALPRPQKQSGRRMLEESGTGLIHISILGSHKTTLRKPVASDVEIFEDRNDVEVNWEVDRFMRGEVSPSKKGDFDCIQGLLSLSQGTWR